MYNEGAILQNYACESLDYANMLRARKPTITVYAT